MCDQGSCETPPGDAAPAPEGLVLGDSDPEDDPSRLPLSTEVRELSSSSEEEEEVGPPPPGPRGPRGAFSLRGGSSDFSHRSRSIFDCLDGVAKATEAPGERALFAKPLPPPPLVARRPGGGEGRRGVPDYLLHPERWTRYSLEDTPLCSERENAAAARGFLQGLQQGPTEPPPEPPTGPPTGPPGPPHRVVFSRPAQATRGPGPDDTRPPGGGELRKYLSHLQGEEGEGEGEGEALRYPGGGQRKRRMEQRGGAREEEEQEEEQEEHPSFVSFKKANRKNYRKTSQQDDV